MNQKLRIGTRRSKLAMVQTNLIRDMLLSCHPEIEIEIIVIVTQGDRVQDRPLAQVGTIGAFTKEIEHALYANEIDLAVHSAKDLPAQTPPGLLIAAVPPREDVRDVLISRSGQKLAELAEGAVIATSSPRRKAQLLAMRPDLQIIDIRGNVDTRLRKLSEGAADAIVLAAAGLKRLDLYAHATEILDPELFMPAVGQGALAVETRADDTATNDLLQPLNDEFARASLTLERRMLAVMQAGCQAPVSAMSTQTEAGIRTCGRVFSADGEICIEACVEGLLAQSHALGTALAEALLAAGAKRILQDIKEA